MDPQLTFLHKCNDPDVYTLALESRRNYITIFRSEKGWERRLAAY